MAETHYNISNEKLDTIITKKNTFLKYYKQMYGEIDLIHEDEEMFVYAPKTFEATEFFDGSIDSKTPCHWDSSNIEEIYNDNTRKSVMYRIHFSKTEQKFNFTYYFDIKNNQSVFQDCNGDNYSDADLEVNYPQYVDKIKTVLSKIEKDFNIKSYRWLRKESQESLKSKYDLEIPKILNALVERINNYKRVNTISILNLLMFMNTNTYNKIGEVISLTSESTEDEIRTTELFVMVSSLAARFYSLDELKTDIQTFNRKHK